MSPADGPTGVAPLSVGAHLEPAVGACLMEVVSRVAGEPWSDDPDCTHALVAHVARLVNDAVSDETRQLLRRHVPALAVAAGRDELTHARVAHACTGYALTVHATPVLAHFHHAAARQLAAPEGRTTPARRLLPRMPARVFQRGPAFRAVEAAVACCARAHCDGPDALSRRDAHLETLLELTFTAAGLRAGDRSQRSDWMPASS